MAYTQLKLPNSFSITPTLYSSQIKVINSILKNHIHSSLQFFTYANDKLIFVLYHCYIHGMNSLLAVCVSVRDYTWCPIYLM